MKISNEPLYQEIKRLLVENEELKKLRMTFSHLQISPKTRTLYLWTKRI